MSQLINIVSLCIDYVYSVTEIAKVGETVASQSMSVFPGGKGLNQSMPRLKRVSTLCILALWVLMALSLSSSCKQPE